jgi:hypothetical protein
MLPLCAMFPSKDDAALPLVAVQVDPAAETQVRVTIVPAAAVLLLAVRAAVTGAPPERETT